jgi:hypothetical protein
MEVRLKSATFDYPQIEIRSPPELEYGDENEEI